MKEEQNNRELEIGLGYGKQSIDGKEQSVQIEDIPKVVGEEHFAITKRLNRKFDLHLMPWLFGIWLFAFIDRSNIGNAKIDGLAKDLKLTGNDYNISLMVFYIPYIIVDVPSNWLVKKVGSGIYLPALITCWGLTSTFLGFTKSYAGLLAARFFLGLCEGGLLGGIIVYLAMFYERHAMGWRVGLFYCAAPLSGAFGGLLATGLAQIEYGGYNRWPWIFFIEGIMTVVYGLIALYFLPDTPNQAGFLTSEERAVAMARLKADAHGSTTEEDVDKEKFDWHWVALALKSPNLWICSFAWFCVLIPLYSFSLFLPTIISALGYKAVHAQLLTVPPYICSFVVVLITAGGSDRFKMRGPVMLAGLLVTACGYIMLLASENLHVKYGGTFLIAIGVYPCSPMVMSWLSNNTAPHYTRATAIGLEIAIANCAAFVATFTYLQKDAPKYTLGHSINLGACGIGIIIVSLGIIYCRWENRQRDLGKRDCRLESEDATRLGHRHPSFRYTI